MVRATAAPVAVSFAVALSALATSRASAQNFRGSISSTAHYLELRPLRVDTIPRDLAVAEPGGGFTFDGLPVSCQAEICLRYRSGAVEQAVAGTHEADLTFWGLGVEGLSVTLLARLRTHLGGDFHLPLTDEPFEAVLGYAQLVRGIYRIRVGRQRELSGLAYSGYDGVDLLVEPSRTLRVQVYGGRSLARGVQWPLSRAFRAVDERDFVGGRNAYLLGGEVAVEPATGSTAALRYQVEMWDDRAGLISERMLLVGRTTAYSPFVIAASAEYDVGLDRLGKAQLDVEYPFPTLGLRVEGSVRRYLPFFEYWTIWGMFSPVAYHEAELRASWSRSARLGVWASGAYRRYSEHHTQTFLRPLEGDAVRAQAGADWWVAEPLRLQAAARLEGAAGAFNAGVDAAGRWQASDRLDVSLHAAVLQQIEEFRLGSGVLVGGGLGVDARLRDDLGLAAGFELYRQTQQNRPGRPDWTQRRAWLAVQIAVGGDPGLTGGGLP